MSANFSFVKCDECDYVIRTKQDDECQCPRTGGGCGNRVNVKKDMVKL